MPLSRVIPFLGVAALVGATMPAQAAPTALDKIDRALPPQLRETAYAVACDVVAADGEATQEELRLLEMLRHRISVDRLTAAAIERGARARYMRF